MQAIPLNSALALANSSITIVSRMAISEQKKVALCDGAARLLLNLFVSTHTPNPPLVFSYISVCR